MRKSFLKAAIPTMAMLLVAVMALTGTTYAWFTETKKATIDTIDIKVTAAAGMKVTTANGTTSNSGWTNTLDVNTLKASVGKVWPADIHNFKAVSTCKTLVNNGLKFFEGSLDSNNSTILSTAVEAGEEYIKFDVYVWNDANSAKNLNFGGTTVYKDTQNSIDATVAARVAVIRQGEHVYSSAFTQISNAGESVAIWADNTDTYYGLKAAGTVNAEVNTLKEGYTEGVTPVNSFTDNAFKSSISANSVAKYTIYIWLEGQDPQCVNTITTGSIKVDLVINMDGVS